MYAITFDSPAICSKHILHALRAQKSIVRSPLRQMLRKSRSSTLSIAYHMFFFLYVFSIFLLLYSLEEESQNIIEVSPYQQTEEQNHTGHLGVFHKLVARFAAGYHLVEEEEHVATV